MATKGKNEVRDILYEDQEHLPMFASLPHVHPRAGISTEGEPYNFPAEQVRTIIVLNNLPIIADRSRDGLGRLGWSFAWDEESLFLRIRGKLPHNMDIFYVGCLAAEIEPFEEEEVSARLLEDFKCLPVFPDRDARDRHYNAFCKLYLWPILHSALPLTSDYYYGGRFESSDWKAYIAVNMAFANKVMEVLAPEDDFVWIQDYHLMLLPTCLRRKFPRIKIGFFLHCPFPSSEIFRSIPVRDDIVRGLLNADLIGFHTFDYARHFLSCVNRALGISYTSYRGSIAIEYYGRQVGIKIMPVGVDVGHIHGVLRTEAAQIRLAELRAQYEGKTVFLSVDDMDVFKGLNLKLVTLEVVLREYPEYRGKIVLIQIVKPVRSRGRDVMKVQEEIYTIARRINDTFGFEGYQPVILLERPVPFYEKTAYYAIADCCLVTAVRDGMNLIPYEYTVCRQGPKEDDGYPKESLLIVSEFMGCSPSLSGAIRVNPWDGVALMLEITGSFRRDKNDRAWRHEKHFKYISSHDVGHWAHSFAQELEHLCQGHGRKLCFTFGMGTTFRVMTLDPTFRKLSFDGIAASYARAKSRAIFLDYDGTMVWQKAVNKSPTKEIVKALQGICLDPRNIVFVVSGREKKTLSEWFTSIPELGIAAEHGYYYRWRQNEDWIQGFPTVHMQWKDTVIPIMREYCDLTDGTWIELKETAVVWHFQDACRDFGALQAKELVDHLEGVLTDQPVQVKIGDKIVEAKPQGVNKGSVVEKILNAMDSGTRGRGTPDFIFCVGDDRSDEDMFESINNMVNGGSKKFNAELFACTVGQKPSKARYYLDDPHGVLRLLELFQELSDGVMGEMTSLLKDASLVRSTS